MLGLKYMLVKRGWRALQAAVPNLSSKPAQARQERGQTEHFPVLRDCSSVNVRSEDFTDMKITMSIWTGHTQAWVCTIPWSTRAFYCGNQSQNKPSIPKCTNLSQRQMDSTRLRLAGIARMIQSFLTELWDLCHLKKILFQFFYWSTDITG